MVFGMIDNIRFIRRDDMGQLVIGNRTFKQYEEDMLLKASAATLLAITMATVKFQTMSTGDEYFPKYLTWPWQGSSK